MRKRKLLFSLLALGLGAFLGGSGAMAQSTNNGWNAILSQTQTTSDDWTPITESTTQGKILGAAQSGSNVTSYYYVTKSLHFTNNRTDNDDIGNSGLKIHGTVYLYVPAGLTITCEGANADGRTGAGAGIELASGNTLYIIGGGTVNATGGSAENGRNGGDGTNADGSSGKWTRTGAGGSGGNGGGGAGAGIGTRGGTGGTGGAGGGSNYYDDGKEDDAFRGTDGSNGTGGGSAGAMGTLYVANGTTVNATGGAAGTSGGAGGSCGRGYVYDGYSYNVTVAAGGGGGGGGFGGAAANIGTGGPGGGGGGGGAGGSQDWRSNSDGGVYVVDAPGGKAGQNANGQWAGDGADAETSASGWHVVDNGSFDSDDWHGKSSDAPSGSRGLGSGKGTYNASTGTQNTGNLEYTITYHWAVPEVTTTTVKYSPSAGTTVVLPQNTIDGYQWALGVYGKDCHATGDASEFTTASKEFYGGNFTATANRTIYLKDVYGNLDFYEVKSVCMLGNSEDNEQEIGDFFVADNNPHANAPKWPITVRLQDRTLYKDNHWNSICLPFSMTSEQIAASPLAGATIKKLNTSVSGYYPSGYVNKIGTQQFDYGYPVVLFWFDDVDINGSGTVLEAGKPYLVKWISGSKLVDNTTEVAEKEAAHATNPSVVVPTLKHQLDFNYVTVKATAEGSWVSEATTNGSVIFAGTFSTTELEGGVQTNLILGPNDKLYYPSETLSVAACRGYFIIPQAAVNGTSAPQFVMGFDDDETTGIQTIDITPEGWNNAPAIYNLSGQRLNSLQKGINIVNGKKVVVK
jgi:hypothetical protein